MIPAQVLLAASNGAFPAYRQKMSATVCRDRKIITFLPLPYLPQIGRKISLVVCV